MFARRVFAFTCGQFRADAGFALPRLLKLLFGARGGAACGFGFGTSRLGLHPRTFGIALQPRFLRHNIDLARTQLAAHAGQIGLDPAQRTALAF